MLSKIDPFSLKGQWVIEENCNLKYEFEEEHKGILNPIIEKEHLTSPDLFYRMRCEPNVDLPQFFIKFLEAHKVAGNKTFQIILEK
ncbi:hypothetical protein [uncultured Arcticibacterium sp.]|uniref:hypothetical protein n=1 Tax=uncultured Arcticibacterium sp. TaxID=2173042 RepID=UPI0030FC6AFB